MKHMFTLSCEDRTIVTGDLTVRTAAIEGDATDSADIIAGDVPFPYCDCVDSFYFDFHRLLSRLTHLGSRFCFGDRREIPNFRG